jgi:O-antigen/teichoic acid export membrane protein
VARAPERAGQYLTATLILKSILSVLAAIGVIIAAFAVGYDANLRALVALASVNLLVDTLGNICNDLLISREKMVYVSIVDVGQVVGLILVAGLTLLLGYGLAGMYVATILVNLGRAAALWLLARRAGIRPAWPYDRAVGRSLLVNGAPLALAGFLSLAYQQVDKIMTTSLIGVEGTGYLTAAFTIIFGVVELISTTLLTATYPLLSRASEEKSGLYRFLIEKLAFFILTISLPMGLVLSIFAAQITVPLFGEHFGPTADVLRILIWYAVITMVGNVFGRTFTVQNRQRRFVAIRASGLILNIALLAVLVPYLRVTGAAVASVCAEVLVLLAYVIDSGTFPWVREMFPRLLRLAGVTVVSAVAMLLLGQIHPLLGMVGGLAIYGGGLIAARVLASDDWDLFYRLVAAMPGGRTILKYWRRNVSLSW